MAGRGRGGGGGRGRGRAAMSFNVEQLGFGAGESLPGPVLQPPPVYPLMENKPVLLQTGVEGEYMLALKRDFVDFLRDSPAYLMPTAAKADIERYSDRYQVALAKKSHSELKFDFTRFPAELRPQPKTTGKRKQTDKSSVSKKAKVAKKSVDIVHRLDELEKKEEQQSDVEGEGDEAEGKEEEEEKEGEGEEGMIDDLEEEDLDEEMDEGTDYINNYFDNGESYLDEEEDNLDDGPIY